MSSSLVVSKELDAYAVIKKALTFSASLYTFQSPFSFGSARRCHAIASLGFAEFFQFSFNVTIESHSFE